MGDFGVRSVPSGPIYHQRVTPAPVSVTLTRPGGGDINGSLVSVVQVGFHLPVSPGSSAFEGDVYPSPVPGSGRLDSSILCSVNRLPYLLRKSTLSPSVPFHLDSLPTLSKFSCFLFLRSLPWGQFAYFSRSRLRYADSITGLDPATETKFMFRLYWGCGLGVHSCF